jgi:hypothetical protein
MLEYADLMHSSENLRKFSWQISTSYLWDPLLYLLIETRHHKIGPEVDRTWQVIDGVFSNHPRLFTESIGALYAAVGKWTLQVWDECTTARKSKGLPEPTTPDYIIAIRCSQTPFVMASSNHNDLTDSGGAFGKPTNYGEPNSSRNAENHFIVLEPVDSYDFSNLLSFDLEPSNWEQWERLLAGQGD